MTKVNHPNVVRYQTCWLDTLNKEELEKEHKKLNRKFALKKKISECSEEEEKKSSRSSSFSMGDSIIFDDCPIKKERRHSENDKKESGRKDLVESWDPFQSEEEETTSPSNKERKLRRDLSFFHINSFSEEEEKKQESVSGRSEVEEEEEESSSSSASMTIGHNSLKELVKLNGEFFTCYIMI